MGVPTDKCGHDDLVWSRYSVSGLTSVNIVTMVDESCKDVQNSFVVPVARELVETNQSTV